MGATRIGAPRNVTAASATAPATGRSAPTIAAKYPTSKAVVLHGSGDIRLDEVKEPEVKDSTDAAVRITSSAICGTDLHMVRGTFAGMEPGTILGLRHLGELQPPDLRPEAGRDGGGRYGRADCRTPTVEAMSDVIEAYKQFDLRKPGWIEVELKPLR